MRMSAKLQGFDETLEAVGSVPPNLQATLERKINELTDMLLEKVLENLSGKILHRRTGALARKVVEGRRVEVGPRTIVGTVEPVPLTAKEIVLELGGEARYLIPIGARGFLANPEDTSRYPHGFFSATSVSHPPSREFGYLLNALREMRDPFEAAMIEVLDSIRLSATRAITEP